MQNKRTEGHRIHLGARQLVLAGACTLALLLPGAVARADENKVLAQEAYERAKASTAQNNYTEACPKFEESLRLEFQIGTLYWLADCQEHINKLASAYTNFVDAADRAEAAKKMDHAKEARSRAGALKSRLIKLIIVVPDEVNKAEGLQVFRDDVLIGPTLFNSPLPIDAGKHVIKVVATGKRAWQSSIEAAGEANTLTITIPALQPEPDLVLAPSATASAAAADVAVAGPWSTPRKAAVAIGAVGLVGVVVGGVFGGLAADKVGASSSLCTPGTAGEPDGCSAAGLRLREEANTFANVANAGIFGGAALVATGVVLWLVAPPSEKPGKASQPRARVAASIGVGGPSLLLRGEW